MRALVDLGGIVLLSLVVLGVAVMSTAARVRRFGNTALSLQRRSLDGEKRLQPQAAAADRGGDAAPPGGHAGAGVDHPGAVRASSKTLISAPPA